MKQMFDISEKLIVGQSDEICGMTPINWEDSTWKHLSLVGDEEVISLSHAKVYVFSDSVLCLGKANQNPQSDTVWEDKLTWFKSSSQYRILDTIDGEPMEFEWNIFPGITTLQLCNKVQEFMSKMSEKPEEFKGRIQYNIEIFSRFLSLLPMYSSTFHQTNVESSQFRAEDNLLISRIQSHHLLLEVIDHDEEEYSVVSTLGKR